VNIGQKGLAFRYTPQPSDTTEFKVIDILGIGLERWRLPEVACIRAYDISVLAENKTFTGYETRLCGLQFIRLTREQKEKLAKYFGDKILSLGRATELAGLSKWDFIEYLSENKVPVVNYDEDEITREFETAKMLSERRVITADNNPDGTISH